MTWNTNTLLEVSKRHVAILGMTGSGKTSTAKLFVQEIANADGRVCILDPIKSDWWGITSSKDGKHPGLPFVILGGPYAHVPLHSGAGKAVGDLVAAGKLPLSICDMVDLEPGGLAKFFIDFAPRFVRRRNAPVHIVIEEAHEFAPKERGGISGDENRLIHWAKKLGTAGRSQGARLIVATQRTQSLHNAILSSCETLIVHRLTHHDDQKPVIKWVMGNFGKALADQVAESVGKLEDGEAWVLSVATRPHVHERVRMPMHTTYDNSRTPDGADDADVKRATVDRDTVAKLIGQALEDARANDPAELKTTIAELKRRVKGLEEELAKKAAPAGSESELRALQKYVQDTLEEVDFYRQRLLHVSEEFKEHGRMLIELGALAAKSYDQRTKEAGDEHRAVRHVQDTSHAAEAVSGGLHVHDGRRDAERHVDLPSVQRRAGAEAPRASRREAGEALEKGPGLILDAAAWWEALGHPAPTRAQVAAISGYAVSGGSFQRYLSTLSSKGLVTLAEGRVSLTPAGRDAAAVPDTPPTLSELRRRVLDVLESGPRKILEVLLRSPLEMARTQVAELAGFEPSGGTFQRYVSTLSSMELIRYPRRTTIAAATWMGGAETRK